MVYALKFALAILAFAAGLFSLALSQASITTTEGYTQARIASVCLGVSACVVGSWVWGKGDVALRLGGGLASYLL